MSKVIWKKKDPAIGMPLSAIQTGVIFTWGEQGEWAIMTKDKAYLLLNGTEVKFGIHTLENYLEATEIEIKEVR